MLQMHTLVHTYNVLEHLTLRHLHISSYSPQMHDAELYNGCKNQIPSTHTPFVTPNTDATYFTYISNIAYKELQYLRLGVNTKSLQWITVQCSSLFRILTIWINNCQGL